MVTIIDKAAIPRINLFIADDQNSIELLVLEVKVEQIKFNNDVFTNNYRGTIQIAKILIC